MIQFTAGRGHICLDATISQTDKQTQIHTHMQDGPNIWRNRSFKLNQHRKIEQLTGTSLACFEYSWILILIFAHFTVPVATATNKDHVTCRMCAEIRQQFLPKIERSTMWLLS